MDMKKERFILPVIGVWVLGIIISAGSSAAVENDRTAPPAASGQPYHLDWALICENIVQNQPVTPAVVFSVSRNKIYCFTAFEDVQEQAVIYHNWIRRDEPVARIKLLVQPPRWSTSSSLHFRDSDKGPWRVEVTNADGAVLRILRFSIVE